MVTGLATGSTGFVLQNNGLNNLSINANGAFTFTTSVTAASPGYNVTVFQSPTPAQTCTVSGAQGTATANVTSVVITCTVGTASIGGTVTGLTGAGLVLQDNAGDNLTINAPGGAFTFKTAITLGNAYSVSVLTQPSAPAQTCIITGGSGTAQANVGNIQVTCSVGTITIGGTIAGLSKSGSGVVLQDNGGNNLAIITNGTFTFTSLLPAGATYAVTILTQPSGPAQTCTVSNGTGTTTAAGNVTNVQIICPAIFHTIGGQVVGVIGTTGNMVITDNGGDNLPVPGNGTFQFVTQIADGSVYDVDIFVPAGTQPQGCVVYNFTGTAISDVTNVLVDCGHNDWAWMDGDNTGNQKGTFSAVTPPTVPPAAPTQNASTPGGRRYPATWTLSLIHIYNFCEVLRVEYHRMSSRAPITKRTELGEDTTATLAAHVAVPSKMTAAILYGSEDLRIERVDVPSVKADEVLLRVRLALTDGTDLKVWKRGYHAKMIQPPAVFGHEVVGEVAVAGKRVDARWRLGMRVVAANSAPCLRCYHCRRGQENLCEDLLFNNGAYAEYMRIPARIVMENMLEVPHSVDDGSAALAEPLACVLRGIHEMEVRAGDCLLYTSRCV